LLSARKSNNKIINAESDNSVAGTFFGALALMFTGLIAAFRRREEDYSSLSLAL